MMVAWISMAAVIMEKWLESGYEGQINRISWWITCELWRREGSIYSETAWDHQLCEPREGKVAKFWGRKHTKFSTEELGNTGLIFDWSDSDKSWDLIPLTFTCDLIGLIVKLNKGEAKSYLSHFEIQLRRWYYMRSKMSHQNWSQQSKVPIPIQQIMGPWTSHLNLQSLIFASMRWEDWNKYPFSFHNYIIIFEMSL